MCSAVCPYPCIQLFEFLKPTITSQSVYPTVIEEAKNNPDALYLDLACCSELSVKMQLIITLLTLALFPSVQWVLTLVKWSWMAFLLLASLDLTYKKSFCKAVTSSMMTEPLPEYLSSRPISSRSVPPLAMTNCLLRPP